MVNSPERIDTSGELQDLLVVSLAVAVMFMLVGGMIYSFYPTVDEEIRLFFTEPANYSGESVEFSEEMVYGENGFNNVYRESAEEVAWCLEIRDDKVESVRHPYKMGGSSEYHVSIKCQNTQEINGVVHTHPGVASTPFLSNQDKETLSNSGMDVMCILSDPVPVRDREDPTSLNCYNRDFEQVKVLIDQ